MATVRPLIYALNSLSITPAATLYWPFNGNKLGDDTAITESEAQLKYRGAATLQNAQVRVNVNAHSAALTLKTRIGGADGNIAVSIASSTTGTFTDLVHTDSVSDGNLVNFALTGGSGSGAITIASTMLEAEHTANVGTGIIAFSGQRNSITTASVTRYGGWGGRASVFSTETPTYVRYGGTIDRFQLYVTTNSRGTSSTATIRINGADGTQTMTLTGNTTGRFEDTTHSDSVSAQQSISWKVATGTGAGTLSVGSGGAAFDGTPDGQTPIISSVGVTNNVNGTRYYGFGSTNAATLSNVQCVAAVPGAFSGLCIDVSSNTYSASTTVTSNKNGSAGNVTVTVGATTTGQFFDTTNVDRVSSGDLYALRVDTTSAGVMTFGMSEFFERAEEASASSSGSGSLAGTGASGISLPMLTGFTGSLIPAAGTTYYWGPGSTFNSVGGTTESFAQVKIRGAQTTRNMRVRVAANAHTNSLTLRLRKAGADANPAATITASTTGEFSDLTNQTTFADGDLVCFALSGGSGSGSVNISSAMVDCLFSSGAAGQSGSSGGGTSSSTTRYYSVSLDADGNASESDASIGTILGKATNFTKLRSTSPRTQGPSRPRSDSASPGRTGTRTHR